MKEVSRKEQMVIDIEYFILCKNQELRRTKDFTFEFEVFEKCREIENRYCVMFENMNEVIDVISSFEKDLYKTKIDAVSIKGKIFGKLLKININPKGIFWLSFYV